MWSEICIHMLGTCMHHLYITALYSIYHEAYIIDINVIYNGMKYISIVYMQFMNSVNPCLPRVYPVWPMLHQAGLAGDWQYVAHVYTSNLFSLVHLRMTNKEFIYFLAEEGIGLIGDPRRLTRVRGLYFSDWPWNRLPCAGPWRRTPACITSGPWFSVSDWQTRTSLRSYVTWPPPQTTPRDHRHHHHNNIGKLHRAK